MNQGYTVPDAAQSLGSRANLLYGWKQQFEEKQTSTGLSGDKRSELMKHRKEKKQLRMEKKFLKKAQENSKCQFKFELLHVIRNFPCSYLNCFYQPIDFNQLFI
ncbi:MAG: transposase [Colwellia sp.]|nr:transposase [Colwellia sp.]